MLGDHMWDDEDGFKEDIVIFTQQSEYVNYQVPPVLAEDSSWIVVELFTGDKFKVSIEQVRED